VCVLIYLLPGFVAQGRKHHNQAAVWTLTILGGWTLLGWIIAFVWALTKPAPPFGHITESRDSLLNPHPDSPLGRALNK
jgi:hypothetical protein